MLKDLKIETISPSGPDCLFVNSEATWYTPEGMIAKEIFAISGAKKEVLIFSRASRKVYTFTLLKLVVRFVILLSMLEILIAKNCSFQVIQVAE